MMKEKMMKGMKMNKALLPLLLCCFIFPASGKDAGWQWYNEKITPKEGNDSNLLIVFYVQIMPDDFVMQLHRF